MTKMKVKKTVKRAVVARGRQQVARVPRSMGPAGLDQSASEYARLIADPCNAKLVGTIWPGSGGSFVSRFEVDYILYNGATEVAGFLAYVPGSNTVYDSAVALTSDTTASTYQAGTRPAPGSAFLAAAGSIRAVAACIQVSFPGTELTRSGIVSGGVVSMGALTGNVNTGGGGGNVTTTCAAIRTLCQHTERMPQDMMEITWFPNSGDQTAYQTTNANTAAGNLDSASSKNALVVTASGFPVSTGIRVRIVTVLEWTPKSQQGLVATAETPKSRNTLNDVLMALPANKGTNWFINAYRKAAPYVRAAGSVISYGAKVLGPALAVL